MKRTLTTEQAAARDARRARFKELVKKVAAMSDGERATLAGGVGFCKLDGGTFSVCNSMLLALQLPQATVLAGFRQWLKAGRSVRKGQHGASIWVPIGGKKETDEVTGATSTDTSGDRPGFVLGTVFDISQTDDLSEQKKAAAANVLELDFSGGAK